MAFRALQYVYLRQVKHRNGNKTGMPNNSITILWGFLRICNQSHRMSNALQRKIRHFKLFLDASTATATIPGTAWEHHDLPAFHNQRSKSSAPGTSRHPLNLVFLRTWRYEARKFLRILLLYWTYGKYDMKSGRIESLRTAVCCQISLWNCPDALWERGSANDPALSAANLFGLSWTGGLTKILGCFWMCPHAYTLKVFHSLHLYMFRSRLYLPKHAQISNGVTGPHTHIKWKVHLLIFPLQLPAYWCVFHPCHMFSKPSSTSLATFKSAPPKEICPTLKASNQVSDHGLGFSWSSKPRRPERAASASLFVYVCDLLCKGCPCVCVCVCVCVSTWMCHVMPRLEYYVFEMRRLRRLLEIC